MYPLASLSIQLSFLIPEYCSHFSGCCTPLMSGSYEAFSQNSRRVFWGFLVPHRCRDKEQLFQPFHRKLCWDVGCGNRLHNFIPSQIKHAYQTITTSRPWGLRWRNRRCFMSGKDAHQYPRGSIVNKISKFYCQKLNFVIYSILHIWEESHRLQALTYCSNPQIINTLHSLHVQ